MRDGDVKVPGLFLLNRRLSPSARLLWLVLQLEAPGHAHASLRLLTARSGLDRHTIVRGLAQLESAGWLPSTPPEFAGAESASLPVDLLLEGRISTQAKLLYGSLQLLPGCGDRAGQTTISQVAAFTGASHNTVKTAIRSLTQAGWLQVTQRNRLAPIRYLLRNPIAERSAGEVEAAQLRLAEAPFLGEALMREYLTLVVDSDEYEDNASPGWLINPYTDEEMQFDRYNPPRVAFEFNGPQHYGPTDQYPKETAAWKQRGRDLIKLGLCVTRRVDLIVLHPEDLFLEGIRRKVEGHLPLRQLDGHEALIAYLESVSRAYRRRARQQL